MLHGCDLAIRSLDVMALRDVTSRVVEARCAVNHVGSPRPTWRELDDGVIAQHSDRGGARPCPRNRPRASSRWPQSLPRQMAFTGLRLLNAMQRRCSVDRDKVEDIASAT